MLHILTCNFHIAMCKRQSALAVASLTLHSFLKLRGKRMTWIGLLFSFRDFRSSPLKCLSQSGRIYGTRGSPCDGWTTKDVCWIERHGWPRMQFWPLPSPTPTEHAMSMLTPEVRLCTEVSWSSLEFKGVCLLLETCNRPGMSRLCFNSVKY